MDLGGIQQAVEAFHTNGDGALLKSRELILSMLSNTTHPLSRYQYMPGHITCTGLVLGPSGNRILLVHHARLERWLLPGGHVEDDDAGLADAARREVREETGAKLDSMEPPLLIGLDVHAIPPKRDEPYHLHHDFVFLFRAVSDEAVCSPESRAVEWCQPADFDRYDVPRNIRLAYDTALGL